MATPVPPFVPARPNEVITPNGSARNDPYAWLRDDTGNDPEIIQYLKDENEYGKDILEADVKQLEKRIFDDMASRVPRVERSPATPSASLAFWYGSTRGPGQDYWVHNRRPGMTKLQGPPTPLSYGPDLKVSEQVVLDINKLAESYKYCDVGAVKPSPDGRFVAFTVDTVGDEDYELVIREVGSGRRVAFAGAATGGLGGMQGCAPSVEWTPDSSAVFAMLLTPRTREAFKVVRCKLLLQSGGGAGRRQDPEVLFQDDTSGAVLEMSGRTSDGRFLMFFRKAEGYRALLALTLPAANSSSPLTSAQQPSSGVPNGVTLYGNDLWVIVTPESDAVSVLRADRMYGDDAKGETFAVLGDTDKYPDGHVFAVTDGYLKRRTVLVPGRRGLQVVDVAVCGGGGVGNGTTAASSRKYLVVQVLENMKASVLVYGLSNVRQVVEARQARREQRRQERKKAAELRALQAPAPTGANKDGDDGDDDDNEEEEIDDDYSFGDVVADGDEEQYQQREPAAAAQKRAAAAPNTPAQAPAPRSRLPLEWSYSPGDSISSLRLEHNCWPGSMPYIRVSYSSLTTPTATVDLDLAAQKAYVRQVEKVDGFTGGRYMSQTLWATSADGTLVPATVAGRTDAWPATTGRPLPVIVQAYGAYGRKLLPDFIPGDLAILDGGAGGDGDAAAAAAAAADGSSGPTLMVLAHVRGGGELGTNWHREGKLDRKINTAEDLAAVVRMLVEEGYARPEAVALWGRSAGGLAVGMTLERSPPGTFRTAVLDVPFLDVLGAMTDPSLPLTIKERPEWGDPASSQEDYDYILSYSPYDNVESLARKTPAMIVTCSLYDPRVPYWGPAKFVARLRAAMATAGQAAAAGGGPVILLTELEAGGHFSVSGASSRLAERALRVAFLLRELRRGMDAA